MNQGLIFDIRRFCVHDGPGIRTTVFFKGCLLSCWWCHNPESRDAGIETSVKHLTLGTNTYNRTETTGQWMSTEEIFREVEKDRIFYDESGGGVTFSGGEPMLQEACLAELMRTCRQQGIHTVLDTSGYATPEAMAHVAMWADLILFDLKIIDEKLHRKYTGVSNVPILKNLKYLLKSGKNVILRFPVIPGITDTPENILAMKTFISNDLSGSRLHLSLLPYHSNANEKYRRFCKPNLLQGLPNLAPENLLSMQKEFEEIGLTVTIGS